LRQTGGDQRRAGPLGHYLLQRIEEFPGVVLLATNLRQNIDDAFLRRVQVQIDFCNPDVYGRTQILRDMFPAGCEPPDDEDLDAFGRQFDFTGGNLRNVFIDAAFRALGDASSATHRPDSAPLSITTEHLVLAAAREYRKLSRSISAASFGRRFFEIVQSRLDFEQPVGAERG
jgi:SpoVK/Ycf46/Vps4 family AAA+-type ATPase